MNRQSSAGRTIPFTQRIANDKTSVGFNIGSIALKAHQERLPARASSERHHTSDALPFSQAVRVMWSLKVQACDIFILCRVLDACDDVDIKCCAPVVKQGLPLIRVDFTLPKDSVDIALHNVLQHVGNAEFGRIQSMRV